MSDAMNATDNLEFDASKSSLCTAKRKRHRSPNGTRKRDQQRAERIANGGVDRSRGPDGFTVQQREFLRYYVIAPTINRAIALAAENGIRICRSGPSIWIKCEHFAKAFKRAKRKALRYLEVEARRRAVEGVVRRKFYRGEVILDETGKPYSEVEYSDALLMFLMKSQMPEKYGDKSKLELAGSLGLSNLNEAELEERERRLGLTFQRFTLPTAEQTTN